MRCPTLIVALIAIASTIATAQESTKVETPSTPNLSLKSYDVQISEFRWKSSDAEITAPQIAKVFEQLKKEGKLDFLEIVRLSALERHDSMVQFGKQTTVTIGQMSGNTARAPSKVTRDQSVGTMVRLTVVGQQDEKVLMKIAYEASRFEGAGTEDSPPETLTTRFETSLLIQPGTPMLVGGTTAAPTSYLLISIAK